MTLALVALLLPSTARADDLQGLSVMVSAVFVGVPGAILLVALLVAARGLVRRGRAAPVFAVAALAACVLVPLAVPLATVALGGGSGPILGLSLLVAAPLAVLGLVTARAARRIGR